MPVMDAISSLLRHIHDKYNVKYVVYDDGIVESKMMCHLYLWQRCRTPEDTMYWFCSGAIHSTVTPKEKLSGPFRKLLDLADPTSTDKLEKEAVKAINFMDSCSRCKILREQEP